MTKEEVIAAVQECAAKLGHVPSLGEFRKSARSAKAGYERVLARLHNYSPRAGWKSRGRGTWWR